MGFSLIVKYNKIPKNIMQLWKNEFSKVGLIAEFDSDFTFETWEGGFLPIELTSISEQYIHKFGKDRFSSGFELSIYQNELYANSPMRRQSLEFFCQCIGMATLANAVDGVYCDGQNDIECKGQDAIIAASNTATQYG